MRHIIRHGYWRAADEICATAWDIHTRGMHALQQGPSAGERRIAEMLAADKKPARATDLEVEGDPRAFLRAMREGR
jgi:hypothetical protein